MPRIGFLIAVLLVLQACSHPLEIEGEGDIVNWGKFGSADGTHSCSLDQYKAKDSACTKNLAITNYDVIYHAAPKQGWVFAGWKGICEDKGTSICPLKIAAEVVPKFWFKTMPATIAVFEEAPASVGVGPKASYVSGMAFDESSKHIFLTYPNDTLVSVDVSSSDRQVISTRDQSLSLRAGSNVDNIKIDIANNRLIGIKNTGTESRLVAVNIATGERSIIASPDVGEGPPLDAIVGMHLDLSNQVAYLASNIYGFNGIARLNLNTGDRFIVSSADGSVGQGPIIEDLRGMTYDTKRNKLVVMDSDFSSYSRLITVDPDSGKRSLLLADSAEGNITYEPHRDRLYINRDEYSPPVYVDMNRFYPDGSLYNDQIGNYGFGERNYHLGKMVFADNGGSTFIYDENLSALLKHHIDSSFYEVISR